MTLRLILIRHAKSSWSDPFADDHARQLNKRGIASAEAIGAWMAEKGYQPDLMICSDADRTRQTADLILSKLKEGVRLQLSARLYMAAPDTILDRVGRAQDPTVAVIGHNPGIGMAANMLVATAPTHHRFSDYPTCATTVIDFEAEHWADIQKGRGTCIDFTVPRDLIGTSGSDIE